MNGICKDCSAVGQKSPDHLNDGKSEIQKKCGPDVFCGMMVTMMIMMSMLILTIAAVVVLLAHACPVVLLLHYRCILFRTADAV
jgi:hypothetical protein